VTVGVGLGVAVGLGVGVAVGVGVGVGVEDADALNATIWGASTDEETPPSVQENVIVPGVGL
jgi:hypothetical protein